jgi:Zn finger protein HypA/HybF involved in hydrogenase expression
MACKADYPSNWRKVTLTIRRIAGWKCEQCGKRAHSVHHKGTPYADGQQGDSRDKHDIRRENLQALCEQCHKEADHIGPPNPRNIRKAKRRNQRKKERKAAQRLLCMPRIEVNA